MSDTKPDLDAIEARAKTAHDEVSRLCCGNDRGWRMSIPANDARDSDLIISTALNDVEDLVAYARTLEAENERLRGHLAAANRQYDERVREVSDEMTRAQAAEAERDRLAQRLDQVRELAQPFSDASTGIVERVTGMHDLTRAAAHAVVSEVLRDVRRVLDGDQRTGEA